MDNMYDTFYDKPICYGHKGDCECTDMQEQSRPTYVLDYEDTAQIPFHICKEYWDKLMIISVYDFRHDLVFETKQFVDEDGYVYLNINKEMSYNIFKRGVYFCGIQAIEVFLCGEENKAEYEYGENVCTIMSQNDCMINVR